MYKRKQQKLTILHKILLNYTFDPQQSMKNKVSPVEVKLSYLGTALPVLLFKHFPEVLPYQH